MSALAGLHDLLTQEARTFGDVQTVSASAALGKLMPVVRSMLQERELVWDVEDPRLLLRQASGLAVCVNEAISNAVKHGGTRIAVSLRIGQEKAQLEVRDNGPGFPPGFDVRRNGHTGLRPDRERVAFRPAGRVGSTATRPRGARSSPLPSRCCRPEPPNGARRRYATVRWTLSIHDKAGEARVRSASPCEHFDTIRLAEPAVCGYFLAKYPRLISTKRAWSAGTSTSEWIACCSHTTSQLPQSMQVSGLMNICS